MMKTVEKPRPSSSRSYGICGHASACGQVAAGPRWLSEDFLLTGENAKITVDSCWFLVCRRAEIFVSAGLLWSQRLAAEVASERESCSTSCLALSPVGDLVVGQPWGTHLHVAHLTVRSTPVSWFFCLLSKAALSLIPGCPSDVLTKCMGLTNHAALTSPTVVWREFGGLISRLHWVWLGLSLFSSQQPAWRRVVSLQPERCW